MKQILFFILMSAIFGLSAKAQTAYIPNGGYNNVFVINVATNTVTDTIAVGNTPRDIAVSPDGSRVYVGNYPDYSVSVINTSTNTVIATIPVGFGVTGICVSPDGSRAYVANRNDCTVNVINTATNTVMDTITVGTAPEGIAISPDGKFVYVANANNFSVSVINTATDTISATITVGLTPMGIAVNPDGKHVYTADETNDTVSVISTATNTVTAKIHVGYAPYGICVSPDGNRIYVSLTADSLVKVINAATNIVTDSIKVGESPEGISVSPDGSKLYVVNYISSTVNVINTATNTVTDTLTGFSWPISLGNFITSYPAPPSINVFASENPVCPGNSITLTACGASSYSWSGGLGTANPVTVMPTANTTYTITGTTAGGTNSASITVTMNIIDTSVTVASATLTANATLATYQWVNCPAMTTITGQTNQSFTATANGNYAVIITQYGCSDTSLCYNITTVGIAENSFADAISVYPNPATNNVTIDVSAALNIPATVEISNIQGQLIETFIANSLKTNIDASGFESDVYFVKVKTDRGVAVKKFVKE